MASVHPAEERGCAPEEHFMSATDSLVADRLCQMALANARRAYKEHVLMILHKGAQGNLAYGRFVDGWVEAEVEGLKGLLGGKARFDEPSRELLGVAPFDFIL